MRQSPHVPRLSCLASTRRPNFGMCNALHLEVSRRRWNELLTNVLRRTFTNECRRVAADKSIGLSTNISMKHLYSHRRIRAMQEALTGTKPDRSEIPLEG
jgi:hypothetical protein